jgi:His-Xaa-Ser system protein HxsD
MVRSWCSRPPRRSDGGVAMSEPPVILDNGAARAVLDLRVYRLTAIKKAAYRIAAHCTVVLGTEEEGMQHVSFLMKPGSSEDALFEAARAFFQELLDQELREQIAEETAPVRTLILAHAFSRTDLIRRT